MNPLDMQSVLNCIVQFNKYIDQKQWNRLGYFLEDHLVVTFPKCSIPPNQVTAKAEFISFLQRELEDLKSMHRDYNFSFSEDQGKCVCKTDFRIETRVSGEDLISGASGMHVYTLRSEDNSWKIASIERIIIRAEGVAHEQKQASVAAQFGGH